MKNLYLITALFTTTLIYSQVKQTNLISNGSFDTNITGWSITNPDTNGYSGFDSTTDTNSPSSSGSCKLVKEDGIALNLRQTIGAYKRGQVGGAGNYTFTFWIKSGEASSRVKAAIQFGSNPVQYGTFSENLAKNNGSEVPTVTAIKVADAWQKVTTTFNSLPSTGNIQFRIYPVTNDATYHVDDVSVKREITQELPATGGFSSGWGAVGSTGSQDNGIYTLNTDNAYPKLVNFDNYVDADTSNKITLKLVNNSANNGLQIVHPTPNGILRYVPVEIELNTTATQTVDVLMEDSDDATVWSGEVGELTFLVKNWDSDFDNGADKPKGAYIAVDQTGSIDFVEYSTSFTASLDDTLNNNIHIYPNPAQDFVYIDNANIDDNVNVFNVVGKRVMSFKIETENQAVDITDLKSGIYFLRLNNGLATKLLKK
jgi:hypothetical protein